MVALAVVLSVVVLLLGVLVAGLLRSHADILKALHDLGAGVGDPTGTTGTADRGPSPGVPVTMGPPLPGERNSTSAPAVAGVTPGGDALAVSVATSAHATLLAFLSSGCHTCAGFWQSFGEPDRLGLPAGHAAGGRHQGTGAGGAGRGGDERPPRSHRDHVHRCLEGLRGARLPVLRAGRRPFRAPHRRRGGEPLPPGGRDGPPRRGRRRRVHHGHDRRSGLRRRPRRPPSASWPTTGSCWRPASAPETRASTRARSTTCTGSEWSLRGPAGRSDQGGPARRAG